MSQEGRVVIQEHYDTPIIRNLFACVGHLRFALANTLRLCKVDSYKDPSQTSSQPRAAIVLDIRSKKPQLIHSMLNPERFGPTCA